MPYPIKNRTAFISMIVLGILLVGIGIFLSSDFKIAKFLIPYVGISATIIGLSEIGLKRFTKISNLNKFTNMQIVSLIVYIIVFVGSIALLFDKNIPIISSFLGSVIIVSGFFVILEAVR